MPPAASELALERYFDSIRHLSLLTEEEERSAGRLWVLEKNPEGLRRLVEGNLRYVAKEAYRLEGMGVDLLDLISEGNLGLIEAAKRYDPERGNRFLSYATWWIRQAMFQAIAEHGGHVRIPQKVSVKLHQVKRASQRLAQELGRQPTAEEIAGVTPFDREEVDHLLRLQQSNLPSGGGSQDDSDAVSTFEESAPSDEPSPHAQVDREVFLQQVREALDILPDRERLILELHFGLKGDEPMTLDEIGRRFDPPITRERVRQLKDAAFRRIRDAKRATLRSFLWEL